MSAPAPEIRADRSSFRRVVDALADRVVSHRGDHLDARCPVPEHGGDNDASLSVDWTDSARGGKTLIDCHRGCDFRSVVAALNLTVSDTFDTPPGRPDGHSRRLAGEPIRRPRRKTSKPAGDVDQDQASSPVGSSERVLVATHTYTDADGVPVFDVLRYDGRPKYSCRTYDTNGRRIVRRAAPAPDRRVLYRLPEVLAAIKAGAVVYVCEGEKDADAIAAIGATATSNPFGATDATPHGSKKWLLQYTATLAGAHVVLVADRDGPDKAYAGYRHVLYVAAQLADIAESVRVVEAHTGKDAADHLAAGHGLDDFTELDLTELHKLVDAFDADQLADQLADTAPADQDQKSSLGIPSEKNPQESTEAGGRVYRFPSGDPAGAGEGAGGPGGGGGGAGGGSGDGGEEPEWFVIEDEYARREDGLFKLKRDQGRVLATKVLAVPVRLDARLVEDLCDGAELELTHVDLVVNRDGEEHLVEAVNRRRWESCSWVGDLPGGPVPFRRTHGGRSAILEAIEATSGDVPLTTMYGALGWQTIAGRWCYVHAGGAMDANGPVPGIRVNVEPPLRPFALPEPPVDVAELTAAVLASVAPLDAIPVRLAAPILGAAYRALLGRCRVTVMPVGGRASGKTGLAALAVQPFAHTARHNQMPGAGAGEDASTMVGLEELRFRAGDMLLPLDDLAPDRGPERASIRAALIARSQFNGTGKQRGKRDGGIRPAHPPRSLPLVTGEEGTTVESADSRIVSLPVARGEVDVDQALPMLDAGGQPELRAKLTAAMVTYYADRMPLDEWLATTAGELRAALRDPESVDPGLDARHSESVAELAVGWRAMLDMATARGALGQKQADELWLTAWEGLVETKRRLMDGSSARTPADRFRELLTTLLVSRRVALVGKDGGRPPDPERYGWERVSEDYHRMVGELVGWTDGDKVWIRPGSLFRFLDQQASSEREPLDKSQHALGQALADAGVIRTRMTKGIRRTTIPVRLAGQVVGVWEVDHDWLMPEDAPDDDAPAPADPLPPTLPTAPIGDPWTSAEPSAESPVSGAVRPAEPPTPSPAGIEPPPAGPDAIESRTAQPAAPAVPAQPVDQGQPAPAGPPRTSWSTRTGDVPRFAGIAAVLDGDQGWLARPGSAPAKLTPPAPPADAGVPGLLDWLAGLNLGHVDGRGQHKGAPLAWGQAWIMPTLRQVLGWPASIEEPAAARKVRKAIAAAGWEVMGEVGAWTRIRRGDRRTSSTDPHPARLAVLVPEWLNDPTPFGESDTKVPAHELAARLSRYAEATGIVWQWSAGVTGAQLAAVTRPQLLSRGPQEMPPPAGQPNRETDFRWQRPPAPAEAKMRYAHLFDFVGLYLGAARSLPLAWGEYEHIESPVFDPNRPGYWKVPNTKWDDALLPDPFSVYNRGGDRQFVWVTTPTLKIATELLDWPAEPVEGYLAAETLAGELRRPGKPRPGEPGAKGWGRLLDKWSEHLSSGRALVKGRGTPTDDAVYPVVKATYSHGVGRFDALRNRPEKGRTSGHPLWRPDFRHAVVAQGRFAIMNRILGAARSEDRYPLAVSVDGIVYASDSPDPKTALPAGFTLVDQDAADYETSTDLGKVHHEGCAPMSAVEDLLRSGSTPVPTQRRDDQVTYGLMDTIRRGGEC